MNRTTATSCSTILLPANIFAGGDAIINESLGLTADEQRVLTGKQPAQYVNLTAKQKSEFDFNRLIGISEADALRLTKITSNR